MSAEQNQHSERLREIVQWRYVSKAKEREALALLDELEEQNENLIALRDDLTLKAYERGQEVERLKEQLESAAAAFRWVSSNHPKVIREMPTELYRPLVSNPASVPARDFTNVPFDAQKGAGGVCGKHGVYQGIGCPYCKASNQDQKPA